MELTLTIHISDLNKKQLAGLIALIGEASGVDEPEIATDIDSDSDSEKLDELTQDMHREGLKCGIGSTFRAPELYKKARPGSIWNDLTPSDRKVLGRRFKRVVDDAAKDAEREGPYIHMSGKTIQNSAIYTVLERDE